MLVSVVIPFYKELDLIGETVASVFRQSDLPAGTEMEVCIGNDGSFSCEAILAAIDPAHRPQLRIAANTGAKGPGGARNTAIALSTGDLIAFLDADDVWCPDKLAIQLRIIARGASFVATGYSFQGRAVQIRPPAEIRTAREVFSRMGIGTSTVLVRRSLIGEVRFRDFRFAQDIDFWYRLAAQPGFIYGAAEAALVVYSTGGSTGNKLVQAKALWKVLRHNRLPPHLCCAILLRYAVRGAKNFYLSSGSAKVE